MNRYSSIDKRTDQLTLDDLRAYQAGQLSGPAQHRVERLMLEYPFYADALDGLDALQQVGGSLKAQTRDLHVALQERIHESATTRRLMPLWVTSLTASVLLVLSVAIYLIFSQYSPARKSAIAVSSPHLEPGTILIDPKSLGTPEPVIIPKRSQPVVHLAKKMLRKERHSVVRNYTTETIAVSCEYITPVFTEEMPVRLEPQIQNRYVNTERAFSDWPPGVKGISKW